MVVTPDVNVPTSAVVVLMLDTLTVESEVSFSCLVAKPATRLLTVALVSSPFVRSTCEVLESTTLVRAATSSWVYTRACEVLPIEACAAN